MEEEEDSYFFLSFREQRLVQSIKSLKAANKELEKDKVQLTTDKEQLEKDNDKLKARCEALEQDKWGFSEKGVAPDSPLAYNHE